MKKLLCVILCLVIACAPFSAIAAETESEWEISAELRAFIDYLEDNMVKEELPDGGVQCTLPNVMSAAPVSATALNAAPSLPDYRYTTGQTHTPIALEERYLYSLLSDELKAAYRKMDKAARNVETGVTVDMTSEEFGSAMDTFLYFIYMFDTPELFYLGATGTLYTTAVSTEWRFCYSISATEYTGLSWNSGNTELEVLRPKILAKKAVFDQRVQEIVSTIPKNAPDVVKEVLLYTKLTQSAYYNLSAVWDHKADDNWTAYGTLCNGYGVCESYAEAFQTLCNAVGIPCTGVVGTAGGGHKWNAVRIDGEWYQCDPTWDDPIGGGDWLWLHYFNLTDEQMAADGHDWSNCDYTVPTCTATANGREYFEAYFEYETAGVLHVFKSACDTTCENCSFTRYAGEHQFENDDSAQCMHCDYRRKSGWIFEDGYWRYYRGGERVYDEWVADSNGLCYIGFGGYMETNQFLYDDNGEELCYIGSSGYVLRNAWVEYYGSWFYLDENSQRLKNSWLLWKSEWYHFDECGWMEVNVWKRDSKGWVYLGENGTMKKDTWFEWCGEWYFLNRDGYMLENAWKKDSKGWVYLGADGRMKRNAWVRDSVGWCYVGSDGYCVTNAWKSDSTGKYCYLNKNGNMVVSAWVWYNGNWYYCDHNGYRVTGSKTIDGVKYRFNANGVLL